MNYIPLVLVAGLQVAVLAKMVALDHRAVQIEASLEFMDYARRDAGCPALPCGNVCAGPVVGLLDLP